MYTEQTAGASSYATQLGTHTLPQGYRRPSNHLLDRTSKVFQFGFLLCMGWLSLFVMADIPIWWHNFPIIVFIGYALYVAVRMGRLTRSQIVISAIALPLFASITISWDQEGLLFCSAYLAAIVSLAGIGTKWSVRPRTFLLFFLCFVIPEYVVSKYWFAGPTGNPETRENSLWAYPPALIPLPENNWIIHIGPWGETPHYTAYIALILGAIGFTFYLETRRMKYLVLLGSSVYLVIFSASRTAYMCAAVMVALFFANRYKRRVLRSWVIIGFGVFMMYGADTVRSFLPDFNSEIGERLVRADYKDVTSGRQWLWDYHLRMLKENPLTGIGFVNTRFRLGNIVEGRPATASSESFYTQVLAAFGVFGICLIAIHAYLITRLLKHGDLLRVMFAGVIAVGTAGASWFAFFASPSTLFLLSYCLSDLE